MSVHSDIDKVKKKLISKWKRFGPYENFGQNEVRLLQDTYYDSCFKTDGIWDAIREFDNWCMNYEGEK